jgi:YHS domain-containing protein
MLKRRSSSLSANRPPRTPLQSAFSKMSMSAWGDGTVDTVTDPVCGMLIDSGEAEVESSYDGIVYYFCSVDCRDRFEEHPDAFLEEHSLFQRSEDQEVLPD